MYQSRNTLDFIGHKFSGVHGYVWKHRFYGTIVVRNNVLFVEPIVSGNQIRFPYFVPSARALVKKKGSLNAYVYKIYSRNIKKIKHVSAELCEKEFFCLSDFTRKSTFGTILLVLNFEVYANKICKITKNIFQDISKTRTHFN